MVSRIWTRQASTSCRISALNHFSCQAALTVSSWCAEKTNRKSSPLYGSSLAPSSPGLPFLVGWTGPAVHPEDSQGPRWKARSAHRPPTTPGTAPFPGSLALLVRATVHLSQVRGWASRPLLQHQALRKQVPRGRRTLENKDKDRAFKLFASLKTAIPCLCLLCFALGPYESSQ